MTEEKSESALRAERTRVLKRIQILLEKREDLVNVLSRYGGMNIKFYTRIEDAYVACAMSEFRNLEEIQISLSNKTNENS